MEISPLALIDVIKHPDSYVVALSLFALFLLISYTFTKKKHEPH